MSRAKNSYVPALDGVRGLAILWVILWHTYAALGFAHPEHPLVRLIVRTGWAGVDLFFALSGYLITTLILAERDRFDLRAFYIRRSLRILPAFYVVLAVELLLLRHVPLFRSAQLPSPPGSLIAALATFWSNYDLQLVDTAVTVGASYVVFWSLCVEEHFYLVWPAFLKLVRTRHARTVVALMVVVALPLLRHVATGPPMRVHMLSHFRVDSILWGALAALWADELPVRTVRILGGAAAAVAGVLVLRGDLSILPPPSPLGASLGYSAIAVAATALVLEAPRLPVLAWPPLVAVGRLSYAMYLVHLVAIDLARFVLHPLQPDTTKLWVTIGLYLAFLVPSIALAAIVHVLVEKPFLALKARLQRTA